MTEPSYHQQNLIHSGTYRVKERYQNSTPRFAMKTVYSKDVLFLLRINLPFAFNILHKLPLSKEM